MFERSRQEIWDELKTVRVAAEARDSAAALDAALKIEALEREVEELRADLYQRGVESVST